MCSFRALALTLLFPGIFTNIENRVSSPNTIIELLRVGANLNPAICAPERLDLTYSDLRELTQRTVHQLNTIGIGRNDRVAIVLPNGPEMATAFVTVACAATTAPLNPGYTPGRV